MINNRLQATPLGVPQGGPLSPLLANIMLDDLDKELEKRGHSFCRYADDFIIFVRSLRAGERAIFSPSLEGDNEVDSPFSGIQTETTRKRAEKQISVDFGVVPVEQCSFLGFTFKNAKSVGPTKRFRNLRDASVNSPAEAGGFPWITG